MASFTTRIKDEVTKLETERCESLAEVCSYIYFNGNISNDTITLFIENNSVARRMFNLIKRLYGVNIKLTTRTQKRFNVKTIYILEIKEKLDDIKYDIDDALKNIGEYSDEEKASFLKGVFLCSGSINDPSKSKYHLEILVPEEKDAILIENLLKDLRFSSKSLKRDKGYMVYLKQAEEISDFIKLLGAINALFYFEDFRIYRDHKNMVNRLNNCEQANEQKSLKTCNEQLENIKYLEDNDLLTLLDEKIRIVIDYRKKYPKTTLSELAEIISMETEMNITKSGINHHFRKIKELVNKHKNSKK
ncbi:MAG: DNA-binding protein WhiA [Erysipelotrichales bacterium]|nr:DNA-binding protein WhiA [Erysipelotrichales bacterium]